MRAVSLFLSILTFAFFSFKEEVRNRFSIEIYYESNTNPGIRYSINQDRIIIYNCPGSPWGCKKNTEMILNKYLSESQSDVIYKTLINLKLDTLKKFYEFKNDNAVVFDGLYTRFKIQGEKIKLKEVTTYATSVLATDSLINVIKHNILTEKYYPPYLLESR